MLYYTKLTWIALLETCISHYIMSVHLSTGVFSAPFTIAVWSAKDVFHNVIQTGLPTSCKIGECLFIRCHKVATGGSEAMFTFKAHGSGIVQEQIPVWTGRDHSTLSLTWQTGSKLFNVAEVATKEFTVKSVSLVQLVRSGRLTSWWTRSKK